MPSSKKRKKTTAKKPAAAGLRAAINVIALIDALEQHVLGQKEMTASQVTAALALLKKTLPDMTEAKKKNAEAAPLATPHEDALSALE